MEQARDRLVVYVLQYARRIAPDIVVVDTRLSRSPVKADIDSHRRRRHPFKHLICIFYAVSARTGLLIDRMGAVAMDFAQSSEASTLSLQCGYIL